MKKLISSLFLYLIITGVNAQSVVILNHNGTSTPYYGNNGFTDAYNASTDGDTIYLPGRFYNPPSDISKSIAIFGAGHYPDSSAATNRTYINSGITISENADSIRIEGLYINGALNFSSNQSVNYATIKRNYINGSLNFNGDKSVATSYFAFINENVINGDIYCGNATQATIANNIILNILNTAENCVFTNNVILGCPYWGWPNYNYPLGYSLSNCLIENNIFSCTGVLLNCNNNTYTNNIFTHTPSFGANISTNNFFNVAYNSIFINAPSTTFDYTYNFHLQNPATYLGTDGNEVGLYGGLYGPYKEGAIPVNPHIQSKTIAPTTDTNGNLNVNIKVAAQEK